MIPAIPFLYYPIKTRPMDDLIARLMTCLAICTGLTTFPSDMFARSLEGEIESLKLPEDHALPATEKLYVVQDRAQQVAGALNISAIGGNNFNPASFTESREAGAVLDYYITNRFFTSASATTVYTELTREAEHLWEDEGVHPDAAYTKRRFDLSVGANLLYGKMRLTRDTVFYFDQYLALGVGLVEQSNGLSRRRTRSRVGDLGFVFWFGAVNAKLGVKDHFFREFRQQGDENVHHLVGYMSFGILLGGERV